MNNSDYGAQVAQSPYRSALTEHQAKQQASAAPATIAGAGTGAALHGPVSNPPRDRTMTAALHQDLQNISDMISSNNGRLFRIVDKTVGVKASNPTNGVAQQEPCNAFQAFGQQVQSLNALLGWQNDLLAQLEQVI